MKKTFIKKQALFVLCSIAVLVLFYAVNNFFWFKINTVPPFNDQAHHLTNGLKIMDVFQNHFSHRQKLDLYPPFYYICGAITAFFMGKDLFSFTFVNIVFFLVLLVSVYSIGKKMFGVFEGVFACVIIALYPYVYGAARMFVIDFSLMALASLCIVLLFYSQGFRSFGFSCAAGIVCLLGMLTKQYFIIYVIGPVVVTFFCMMKFYGERYRQFSFFVAVGFVLPLLWYYFFLFLPTKDLLRIHVIDADLYSPAGFWNKYLFYFKLLPEQVNWVNCFVFIFSFIGYLWMREKEKVFVLVWMFVPMIILISAPLKSSKYSLALLPVIALISAWGIGRLRNRALRNFMVAGIILYGLLLHYVFFFNMKDGLGKKMPFLYSMTPYTEYVHYSRQDSLYAVQKELFRVLQNNVPKGRKAIIGITDFSLSRDGMSSWVMRQHDKTMDGFIVVNDWGMIYFIMKNNLSFEVHTLSDIEEGLKALGRPIFDFLVTVYPLKEIFPGLDHWYRLCAEIPCNNGTIYCYEKNKSTGEAVPEKASRLYNSQWVNEKTNDGEIGQAQISFQNKQYDQSIELLKKALKNRGLAKRVTGVAYIGLASNYVEKMVRATSSRGQLYRVAQCYFNRAIEFLDSNDALHANIYSGLGYLALTTHNDQQAFVYLSRGLRFCSTIKVSKEYEDICTNLGCYYMKLKDFDKAEEWFTRVLLTYPKDAFSQGYINSCMVLVNSYMKSGQIKKAEEWFIKVLSVYPGGLFLREGMKMCADLGNSYMNVNNFKKAQEWFRKALMYPGDDYEVFKDVLRCFTQCQRYMLKIKNKG